MTGNYLLVLTMVVGLKDKIWPNIESEVRPSLILKYFTDDR